MATDIERINHLQWRLNRIENFIGESNKKRITETINELNEQVLRHAVSNNNAARLFYKIDDIIRLTGSSFQRFLLSDRATKLKLILADEERIRAVTKYLSEIDSLANVLNGENFQEIPKLLALLNKLLTVHDNTKNQYGEFTEELSTFLQDYAAFTLMMDENLQQYKTILNKTQQTSSNTEDSPVE